MFKTDLPGSSKFYFDKLVDSKIVKPRTKVEFNELREQVNVIRSKESQFAVLTWFPIYNFVHDFCDTRYLDPDWFADSDAVLFVNRGWMSDRARVAALSVAIRDSWITLKTNPLALEAAAGALARNEEYTEVLERVGCGGLIEVNYCAPPAAIEERICAA